MKNSSSTQIAVIGAGNMGTFHAKVLMEGKIAGAQLAAVCDANPEKLRGYGETPVFSSTAELFQKGKFDAVLIATPHYSHTTIGIQALERGFHVLVEKPISVHKADCERLIASYKKSKTKNRRQVFAAMFNQRTNPAFKAIRKLIQNGELGELRRINWIVTNWFRTHAYYASGGWRATWGGEGGGVLLNQCPHQLDLLQWFFGMPKSVRSFCAFGKYHDIEVEDDVTTYMEYPNKATGVFVTSTGETPGTNRLEITGERGRLVWEGGNLLFHRNEVPMSEFSRKTPGLFSRPPFWNVEIPCHGEGGQHQEVLQNFADSIRTGVPLIAPAEEGIHSVELANSMLLSAFTQKDIALPINSTAYERELMKKIRASKSKSKSKSKPRRPLKKAGVAEDFSKSFR